MATSLRTPTQAPDATETPLVMERNVETEPTKKVKTPFGEMQAPNPEDNFYKKLINPMMDEMEASVAKNTAILDKIQKDMEADRKQRFRKILQSHIPEELQGSGKKEAEVMQLVEQLVFYEDVEEREMGREGEQADQVQINDMAHLQELDETSKLTVTAHSLVAHFSTLESSVLDRVASKVESDCKLWLSRLFRFKDSIAVYHDKRYEGLARVARLALLSRYPKYVTEGFEALYSRPPVIYISSSAHPALGTYLCQQLGLPLSCVCTVPCNTLFGASGKMDVAMLEKLIQDDVAAAKTPVLLIAFAGTPVVGHVDNLQRLQEISQANNIWLHVEGLYLATLTLFSVPSSVEQALSGDSLTLDLSRWLGVPSLPYITLFRDSDQTLAEAAGLMSDDIYVQLKCLPLWMCLQSLGHEGMVNKVKHSCMLARVLFEHLDKISTIRQISREKKKKQDKEVKGVKDLISKAINALLVFEMVTPTVVFKYAEDSTGPGAVVASYSSITVEDANLDKDAAYFDALNTWLAEALQVACPQVPIDLVEIDKEGMCIRYSPLETAQVRGTTAEDVNEFAEALNKNLSVLNATTIQRKKFKSIVGAHTNLKLVELDSWAGLGAVSYVPEMYANQDGDLTDKAKIDINNLNSELVHKLKAQDTAFSTGQTEDGMICVRFGLITEDTDVNELVSLVFSTGQEVEESSKFLETMAEMIRVGITAANKELEKESEVKLINEGVLRQVPVVSSLLNWFSPSKEVVKGRTFNLNSGKILPTSDTYKYHMQLQEDAASEPKANGTGVVPPNQPLAIESPEGAASSGTTMTAGQVKAQLVSQSSAPASPSATATEDAPSLQTPASNSQQSAQEVQEKTS